MDDLKIIISLNGLKDGEHQYNYSIGDSFFEQFEYSEIQKGKAAIVITMTKSAKVMELQVGITGKVEVACDLCLELFYLPFTFTEKVFVKYGTDDQEVRDDILTIKETDTELELTHYIYESVCLSLPYKKIHQKTDGSNGCNKLMIKKLNSLRSENDEHETDPRWDKLKDIIN